MTTDDLYKYPSSELDSGKEFLANLGSFWSFAFTDSAEALATGTLELNWQTLINYLETVAAVSRFTVPVYHTKLWSYITIRKSEVNSSLVAPLTYDDNHALYGQSGTVVPYTRTFSYGDAISIYNYRFSIPGGIQGVQQALDKPVKPNTTLQSGIDFTINNTDRFIEFVTDPFASGKFTTRSVINPTSGLPDEEIELWLFKASIDLQIIYEQFGYVLGVYFAKSSDNYRQLLNAIWDAAVTGPTSRCLRRAIAAIADVPVVRNPVEVVQKIITNDIRYVQIITDLEVYTYSKNSVVTVTEGATVVEGDFLVRTVQIGEDAASIQNLLATTSTSLVLGRDLCTLPLDGTLTFHHGAYPTSYSVDGDGFAIVTFTGIDGSSADLTTFWNHATTVGKATGKSVARALRNNPTRTDEPATWDIPTTVSPAMFLVNQVFGSNLIVIYIDLTLAGPNALGKDALKYLRRILPAHKTVLANIIE